MLQESELCRRSFRGLGSRVLRSTARPPGRRLAGAGSLFSVYRSCFPNALPKAPLVSPSCGAPFCRCPTGRASPSAEWGAGAGVVAESDVTVQSLGPSDDVLTTARRVTDAGLVRRLCGWRCLGLVLELVIDTPPRSPGHPSLCLQCLGPERRRLCQFHPGPPEQNRRRSLQGRDRDFVGEMVTERWALQLRTFVNVFSLLQAVKEEGQDPEEMGIALEATSKKMPKRCVKGQKMEEEGTEDNGLEEDSRDGQEEAEAGLESLRNMDMLEVGVLEESEVESSAAPDFGEDGADGVLASLCDGPGYAAARLRELPVQLAEHAVDGEAFESTLDASSLDYKVPPDIEDPLLEPGTDP
uniref:Uncharacterized protein n=1 Tax=Suricata suricatta TaxID=37032 RepID=A0A673TCM9_SURSU